MTRVIGLGSTIAQVLAGSFQGCEAFLMDLSGICHYVDKGRFEHPSYITAALLGQFKGATGEHYHLTLRTSATALGILRALLAGKLAECRAAEGRFNGPTYTHLDTGCPLCIVDLDPDFHTILCQVQLKGLVDPDVDVADKCSLNRTLTCSLVTCPQNADVFPMDIDRLNHWVSVENSGVCNVLLWVQDHHSEIKFLVTALLRYSLAL